MPDDRLNGKLGRMVNARGVGDGSRGSALSLDGGRGNGYSSSSRVKCSEGARRTGGVTE